MDKDEELSYLGDLVTNNGSNMKNIKQRVSKGVGIIGEIFNILDNICFGTNYFKMVLLLRDYCS